MVECRYRGYLMGWLIRGKDGFLKYHKAERTRLKGGAEIVWTPWTTT